MELFYWGLLRKRMSTSYPFTAIIAFFVASVLFADEQGRDDHGLYDDLEFLQAVERLESALPLPKVRVGKVKITKVPSEDGFKSNLESFYSSKEASKLWREMQLALDGRSRQIELRGCEHDSWNARFVPGKRTLEVCQHLLQASSSSAQLEFFVREIDGGTYQCVRLTGKLWERGIQFSFREELAGVGLVTLRSDSRGEVIYQELLPLDRKFLRHERKIAHAMLGLGKPLVSRPRDIHELSSNFYRLQDKRMVLHGAGSAFAVGVGVAFLKATKEVATSKSWNSWAQAPAHDCAHGCVHTFHDIVTGLSDQVFRRMRNQSPPISKGMNGFEQNLVASVLSRKGDDVENLNRLLKSFIKFKQPAIATAYGLAGVSWLTTGFDLHLILEEIKDPAIRSHFERALVVIHTAALVSGFTYATTSGIGHVHQRTLRFFVDSSSTPGTGKMLREAHFVTRKIIEAQLKLKGVLPKGKELADIGSAALLAMAYHGDISLGLLAWLQCPVDEILSLIPAYASGTIQGWSDVLHHNSHGNHARFRSQTLPKAQIDAESHESPHL